MTYVRGAQRKVRVMLTYTVHHPVVREETWEDVKLIRGTLVFVLTGQWGLAQAQVSTFRAPGFAPEEIRLKHHFYLGGRLVSCLSPAALGSR